MSQAVVESNKRIAAEMDAPIRAAWKKGLYFFLPLNMVQAHELKKALEALILKLKSEYQGSEEREEMGRAIHALVGTLSHLKNDHAAYIKPWEELSPIFYPPKK